MHAQLVPYAFEDHLVRVIEREGELWFVLADVCRVLDITNVGNVSARLDDDERGSIHNPDVTAAGGNPNITIINESGLYSLVLTSRKPAAKRFKKWVTAEVLPSIRRTGRYVVEGDDEAPDASGDVGPLSDISIRARLVEISERLSGKDAARALWRHLGLPWVAEMEPRGAIIADEHDAVARFAAEGIQSVPGVVTTAAILWPAFCAFCRRHNLHNAGERSFQTRFGRMGFNKRKVRGRSVFYGIRPASLTEAAE